MVADGGGLEFRAVLRRRHLIFVYKEFEFT